MQDVALLKQQIEDLLRRVIVRTERLASSADRNGMLREMPAAGLHMLPDDARVYCALQDATEALEQPDITEYWKAAPYLFNVMDEYELKKRMRTAIGGDGRGARMAGVLRQAERDGVPLLLSRDAVEDQQALNVPHARMRWLLDDVVGRGTWKLLWLPPSHPYYQPAGPFADQRIQGFTKRLVFSSWQVVPKAIATIVSYEAERRMLEASRRAGEPFTSQIERLRPLLNFARTGDGRLTGMSLLALMYPSVVLAEVGDPIHRELSGSGVSALPSYQAVVAAVMEALRESLERLVVGAPTQGASDDAWYWAAPLLLDAERYPKPTREWVDREHLAASWMGGDSDDPEEPTGWHAHVERFTSVLTPEGRASLGPPPADLLRVLAELAVAGPAVCALRALARSREAGRLRVDHRVRPERGTSRMVSGRCSIFRK